MVDSVKNDIIKIGTVFGSLVVAKILDNQMYECKCLCNNLEVFNGESLLKGEIKRCSKCKNIIKMKLDERNKKELYYIWNKFKELYNKPTKRFKEEIIDKGIKFFPTIFDKENGFEFFYNWAILNNYRERGRECNLKRKNELEDFNEKNCYWSVSSTYALVKLPNLNQEREYVVENNNLIYYEEDYDDSELDCENNEFDEDDYEMNLEEIKKFFVE
ncbi:MAG: hypothetical protein IJZ36_04860 [Bacilli bacterium]|nr:hypothetical protein [Bacilli bacterium]